MSADRTPALVRAGLYCRVSTDDQARDGFGLGDQEERGREVAARHGWEAEVYADPGRSGADRERPELRRLLADVEAGDLDVVWFDSQDRLARDVGMTAEIIAAFVAADVEVWERFAPIDLSDDGQAQVDLKALFAAWERRKIKRRTKNGIAARARTTGKPWGSLAYGLRRDADGYSEWDPAERPIVERVIAMRQAGMSKSAIARDLTRDGVPTRNGAKLWAPVIVAKILRGREPLGEVYVGGEWRPAKHPAIIGEDEWLAVQALDEQSRKYAPGGRSGRTSEHHLFQRGLLRCVCGAAMLPRTPRDAAPYYVCRSRARDTASCSTPRLRAADVDARAFEMFRVVSLDLEATRRDLIEQLDARAAETRALADRAEREVAELAAQESRVEGDYRRGALAAEVYSRLVVSIAEERHAAVEQAARLARRISEVDDARRDVDAEEESLRRIAALREGIARQMAEKTDVAALRAAMVGVFETVVLVPWEGVGFHLKPLFRRDVADIKTGIRFDVAAADKMSGSGVPL